MNELRRIMSLPKRPPVNCERDASRRWAPEAQALVDVMTSIYTRGPRLSCGCRERRVVREMDGRLTVYHTPSVKETIPPLPKTMSVEEFLVDNAHDHKVCAQIRNLAKGYQTTLPGLGHPMCLVELNPVQSWILLELPRCEGVHGMVSVGGGKTIAGLLAPLAMMHKAQCKTGVILAKPDQRIHYRAAYLRLREHFKVPNLVFYDQTSAPLETIDGMPVLHFVPYSMLSKTSSTDLLRQLNPGIIIADESHLLGNKGSSRTMRFLRYMTERNDVVFLHWSGSLIKKSIKDASHLSAHSLGMASPYPIPPDQVELYSGVIDPSPVPDLHSTTAQQLAESFAGMQIDPEADVFFRQEIAKRIREGFRERTIQTPGVIATASSSVNCSITIKQRKAPTIPEAVKKGLSGVRNEAVRPDGEELVEAVEMAVTARTVGAGYHYYWAYPHAKAEDFVENGLNDRWFAARKAFNKELRIKMMHGERHMDSRKLCEEAAERAWRVPRYEGELPVWPADSWPAWVAIKDLVKPDPRVKWIDDYLARDAAQWATENRGIVWVQASEFGQRIAELAGIQFHGGGPKAEERLLAEDGSRSIVCSIKAHSQGRDGLQHRFHKQLVAEIPSSSETWEQLLGRLAREGQEADEIETFLYLHIHENTDAFRKALTYAEFVQDTTGNKQLLLAADIDFEV